MRIKAIYRIPAKKEILLIASFQNIDQGSPKPSGSHIWRIEEIERIRHSRRYILSNKDPEWSVRIVREDDFLTAIEGLECKMQAISNQSFDNSENMELLAINLLKTPLSSNDLSFNTPKILGKVPNEDIIEVFI